MGDIETAQTSRYPVLYSFRRCPYAMRARLAIASSGQRCEIREIVLRDKAPEFLEASPKGTVPVLVDEYGKVIDESLDIMRWALGRHDPEAWIEGRCDADMSALIAECDETFKPFLDRYKYAPKDDAEMRLAARFGGAEFIMRLEEQLAEGRWLFGETPSLADMALLPFVRQFANVDKNWFDAAGWPNVIRWLDGFTGSERFAKIMQRYEKWQAGHEVVMFGD